jgi:hypothetical protein
MTELPDDAKKRIATALDYHRRGWQVIPVRFRGKEPLNKDWPKLRLSEDEIPRRFASRCNIGVLLGEPSGGLVDVDLDCPEAIAIAGLLLPPTAHFGHASKPDSHYFYKVTS